METNRVTDMSIKFRLQTRIISANGMTELSQLKKDFEKIDNHF